MWLSPRFLILLLLGTLVAIGVQGQTITEFPVSGPYPVPDSITSGPDGNLWFTEQCGFAHLCEGKICRITPAGVITEFSAEGMWPGGIAAGPDGNLWFTMGSLIGRISPTGDVTRFPLSKLSAGPGIVAGPDGSLWFTGSDTSGSKIGRITTTGVITSFAIPPPDRWPYGIAAGPDGNLWFTLGYNDFEEVAGNGKIGRITPTGVITLFTIPTDYSGPAHIAAGPDGSLWFTEPWSNRIGRITTTGVITEFTVPTPDSWPFAIAAGPDGAVWFTHADKVGRISTSGEIIEFSIPTANAGLSGITSGPDGNIWFAEANVNKIGRLALGGVPAACVADSTTLCLTGARFQARVTWTTSDGRTGAGKAASLTGNAGYFWFFSSDNVEVMVKIVDGRALNSNYWVFIGGLTDVHVVVTVTDTATGAVRTYTNPMRVAFQPIQDTTTFRGP
jgi:streptogramin lyase